MLAAIEQARIDNGGRKRQVRIVDGFTNSNKIRELVGAGTGDKSHTPSKRARSDNEGGKKAQAKLVKSDNEGGKGHAPANRVESDNGGRSTDYKTLYEAQRATCAELEGRIVAITKCLGDTDDMLVTARSEIESLERKIEDMEEDAVIGTNTEFANAVAIMNKARADKGQEPMLYATRTTSHVMQTLPFKKR